jgi:hypothetical protein
MYRHGLLFPPVPTLPILLSFLLFALTAIAAPGDYALSTIAVVGDSLTVKGQTVPYSSFSGPPVINNGGGVALRARISGLSGHNPSNPEGIVHISNGSGTMTILAGNPAPVPGDPLFRQTFPTPSLNDAGEIAISAHYGGGSFSEHGVFLFSEGTITAIALPGDEAPETGGETFVAFSGTSINEAGNIAFGAKHTPCPIPECGSGIFLRSGDAITTLALEGDPAPDAGGEDYQNMSVWGFRALNSLNEVIVFSQLTGLPSNQNRGLFVVRAGTDTLVSIFGEVAPGTGGQIVTNYGSGGKSVNDLGDVAFRAVGGTCPSIPCPPTTFDGIFLRSGGITTDIALVGDPAPSTGGSTFTNLDSPVVGPFGEVTFTADFAGGSIEGGGLFIYTPGALDIIDGVLKSVVLDGDPAPGTEGETISVFVAGNVNVLGEIAFTGETSGGVGGVFLATPIVPPQVPTLSPSGIVFVAWLLVGGAYWMAQRQHTPSV